MTQAIATPRIEEVAVLPAVPEPSVADEGNHRIANSLQLLAGMVSIEARRIKDPVAREAFDVTLHRIHAIAGVHRQLYLTRETERVDLGAYLVGLGEQLQNSIGDERQGRLVLVDADQVAVAPETATSIGVIVSELVSNAFKHAYRPGQPGAVSLMLRRAEGGSILQVVDHGPGLAIGNPMIGSGLGLRLVEMMARRFGTTPRWTDARPGACCTLHIPPC